MSTIGNFLRLKLGTGLTGTDEGSGVIRIDAAGGGAPTGTAGGALDGTYPNPGLAASVAGAGLSETSDVLSVNVDGTTLAITSDALKVNTDGNAAHYLDGSGHWTTPAPAFYEQTTAPVGAPLGAIWVDTDG